MKKLLILALALVTMQVTAQEEMTKKGKDRIDRLDKMTPEETAEFQTKKMTLALDLTEEQQVKVNKINLENAKERKAKKAYYKAMKEKGEMKKLSDEEKLKMKNDRLDKKIAYKKQMKEILNEKQYELFSEKMAKNQNRLKNKTKSYKSKDSKTIKSE